METVDIVIVEDDFLVRAGLEALLGTVSDVKVVATCGTYDEAIAAIDRCMPHVVLTDIRLPPTETDEGIRLAEHLRTSGSSVGVVVLSQYIDPGLAYSLFEHGSSGRSYLLKSRMTDFDRLTEAIRSVATGHSYIDDEVVDALIAARHGHMADPLEMLSAREREVLAEMATGRSNTAIAERLFVGERAVEKHISSIFAKLELPGDAHTINRRVRAVLVYLQHQRGLGTSD